MKPFLIINNNDNVAVALKEICSNETFNINNKEITINQDITRGHKFAIDNIEKNNSVIKYGIPIGHATENIKIGDHVHIHNIKTNLHDKMNYTYNKNFIKPIIKDEGFFLGYPRKNSNPGVRNEVWIIPTVGCVNTIGNELVNNIDKNKFKNIDGIYLLSHPYGCSQLGDDHENTKNFLASLVNHPNAAGVLVLGLGCENNSMKDYKEAIGEYDDDRVKFLICQNVDDEIKEGLSLLNEICNCTNKIERTEFALSNLVIGLKCGGSDGLSGVTANPLVGKFSDMLIQKGGSTILTEVPEMFGAEQFLMERAINKKVFEKIVYMINNFKDYFLESNQPIYENPSPGNKDGGITTLEDKSLGCTQKGGLAPVVDVLNYAELITEKGLNLLYSPGNDLVASSALASSGAQIILFTTGRGTPFCSLVPTIKISTNSQIYNKKPHWIDFDAGQLINDTSINDLSKEFFDYVISVASGKKINMDKKNIREIAIFKTGITL